jgi:hypothetical protein
VGAGAGAGGGVGVGISMEACSAPYWQTAYSGIFLPHSGIRRPQRGIIGISLLAVTFWNNCFILEKIF